ncbi:aromatic acid decarboxylase [Methanosarcinales archaeon]|nr:MAG: aromatic acid decarboxylase [Methanosarcinales archaeon]
MEIVLGITGASGVQYGLRVLELLKESGITTHLIISETGRELIRLETETLPSDLEDLASFVHANNDLTAPPASGSHQHDGMIIAPCSMKTLASLASGVADTLITRAGDVCLKENRPLILLLRETPLSTIHLENMLRLKHAGAHILPASPAFYHHPTNINDLIDFITGRILDLLKIEHNLYKRWD